MAKCATGAFGYKSFRLTESQEKCLKLIDNFPLVFIKGDAGSGKSSTVLMSYVNDVLADPNLQLIILRTHVEVSDDRVGALPDGLGEKIAPTFASTKNTLETLYNKETITALLANDKIRFEVPNFLIGTTFDNKRVFIDEAQQLSPMVLKMLLERMGQNTKCCVAGDDSQIYEQHTKRNALKDADKRFFNPDGSSKSELVARFEFTEDDIVRSELTKVVVKAYKGTL